MKKLIPWRRILLAATACALAACSDGPNKSSDATLDGTGSNPGTSNAAPSIAGSPLTSVSAGQSYSFQPTASDPDGQALSFSVTNKPSWAAFSSTTGRLSGTPTAAGTYANVTISVSDGSAQTSLAPFSIAVVSSNRPPVISGNPPTAVTSGQAYTFTPTASDPDGQTLTFSISGRPNWANFNTTTGRLSGTPSSTQTGIYSSITISVSDGISSVSLPAFSITVAAVPTAGSATLRWTPPTLNEDGTPIENLSGYRVYYGTNASNLSQVLNIASPAITSAVIENLYAGTWYFALKAYNSANVESSFSNIASKTI